MELRAVDELEGGAMIECRHGFDHCPSCDAPRVVLFGVDYGVAGGDYVACTCRRCAAVHRWRRRPPPRCRQCGQVFEALGDPLRFDRRFFDPRPPTRRRQDGAALCERFNRLHAVGTPIRVWPMARWLDDCWRDTVVAGHGAFVNAAGLAVVKVPGDCIALTHVMVIA